MTAQLSAPWQLRTVRVLQGLTGLALLLHFLLLLPVLPGRGGHTHALSTWLYCAVSVLAAALCGVRALLVTRARAAWSCLAVGLALYALGNICFFALVDGVQGVSFPSGADLLWLLFYPSAYAGIALLSRREGQRSGGWLDGLVAGLGAAAVASAFLVGELLTLADDSSFSLVVTNIAYPIGDLTLLMVVVVAIALVGWRPGRGWWLLAGGLVAFSAADTVYLVQSASGTYRSGTLLDVFYSLAVALPAYAAWAPEREQASHRVHGWYLLAIPTGFALAALAVLVYGCLRRVNVATVELATAAVVLAIVRAALTFREVRALAQTRKLAHTDDLTGLGNRRHFYQRLNRTVAARRGPGKLAVLIIDLDRFKEVNDSLGHQVGDQLLRLVGSRLSRTLRGEDTLARLGGDEFAVLLRNADVEYATALGGRLRGQLERPFTLDGVSLHITASVGIAICPDHASTPTGLMQQADIAMYAGKRGRGLEIYQAERDGNRRERLETVEALRAGLARGELVLHYQPKVNLQAGSVTGMEALVRWQHPSRGLLLPDAFLALAEHAGLMGPLTETVLNLAMDQCRIWRVGGREVTVAVNISASNLLDGDFPDQVAGVLARTDLPGRALVLELTESTLMAELGPAADVLEALHALGVTLSIDDYGIGYSSLAYLRKLPVDELKLDKSFVMGMADDPRAAEIVRSTVGLAHSLGLSIVAEGVETQAVLEQLTAYGCDIAQGYHLSPPEPATAAERWLALQEVPLSASA